MEPKQKTGTRQDQFNDDTLANDELDNEQVIPEDGEDLDEENDDDDDDDSE